MELVKLNKEQVFTVAHQNIKNTGVVGAATVVAKEYGDGVNHVTELDFTSFIIGPLAGAAAAKALVPASPLYTLPAGVQLLEVSYVEVALTAAGTAVSPEIGFYHQSVYYLQLYLHL